LRDGLDPAVVESLRKKVAAAAPEHCKSLTSYEDNALEAGERAFKGEATLNFPRGMDLEARRLHAICRYLRTYDFLTGSLVRIHSLEKPSLVTVVSSKVEVDCYLQDADEATPTEHVTTYRHAHRLVKAKNYAYALHNSYGPVVFCQQQIVHDSFSLCHPSLELCAKSTVAPNDDPELLIMACAGRALRCSLAAAGFVDGHASLVHADSCFRWQPFDLRSASSEEIQRVLRSAMFLSYRISTSGSRATNVEQPNQSNAVKSLRVRIIGLA
jgi:hypothetical protein